MYPCGGCETPFVRKGFDKGAFDLSFSFSFWLPSSMVEQLTLNQLVPGSSPGGATKMFFLTGCR